MTDVPFYVLIIAMYIAEDTPKAVLCLIRFKSRKWIKQLTAADSAPPVLGEDPEIEIEEADELKIIGSKYNHKSKRPRRAENRRGHLFGGK